MADLDEKKAEDLLPEETVATEEGASPEEATPEAVETAEVPAAEEVAAEEAPKYSETFRNRIKSAYPDEEFADDEAFFAKASEQLDNLEGYRNKNMEANQALMEIFDAEPVVAEVLKDMIKGASFRSSIARHFSADELTPQEGAPDEEEWKKNAESRKNRLKENEEYNKKKMEATEFSTKSIKEFADETNLSEDQATEFLSKVGEALDEVYEGKISKTFLMSMYRALNYDNDIKNAQETGRITGRNEKIETKKEDKSKGDGLPVVSGGSTPPKDSKPKQWVDEVYEQEKRRTIL